MAQPALPDNNVTTVLPPGPTSPAQTDPGGELLRRQKELEEFYASYDVWTGIRTAVTLALFFVFTVTVILYKSKCKPRRKYELYPSLEDMPGRPLDYYDCWFPGTQPSTEAALPEAHKVKGSGLDSLGQCYNGRGETGSAPLPIYGSVRGSYSSLNNSFRIKSLPGSVLRINCSRNSSFERDEGNQATCHTVRGTELLAVPGLRLQSTGSSSEGSSTHDGEPSSMALLGVPGQAPRGTKPLLQLGGMDWASDQATAEWVQTIDINVIQPTPNISPCGSMPSVSDAPDLARLPLPPGRPHPGSLSSLDSPESDSRSIGSDSVFTEDWVGSSPALSPSPRASPRPSRHVVQSFRLGINPASPSTQQRGRTRRLQRQEGLGGSREGNSREEGLGVLGQGSSREEGSGEECSSSRDDGPCRAVFTVPSLRRCSSATAPQPSGEASCWGRTNSSGTSPGVRRADSAGAPPGVRRADSAGCSQPLSSQSSSDEPSDSLSFHLMVPALSLDEPSPASTPSLSPPSSLTPSPLPSRRSMQPPNTLVPPSPKLNGAGVRGGRGRRGLQRQYSQCVSLPPLPPYTYLEGDDPCPPAPPPSPFRAGHTLYIRRQEASPSQVPQQTQAVGSSVPQDSWGPVAVPGSPSPLPGRDSTSSSAFSRASPPPPSTIMETSC